MRQQIQAGWSRKRRPNRVRVLIEEPSAALRLSGFRLFEEAGLDVAVCPGPDDREPCPLVLQGECPLALGADVVVIGSGLHGHDRQELAQAWQRHHPDTPVLAEVSMAGAEEPLPGCRPLLSPSSVQGQISAIWHAVESRR
ncbi:MAG: hypothetical protein QOJ23_2975 [Actinomycetota bacterium]|jgi:hypothetical protein|nr:hypothetical protein [Actinomycetota bacterium]